MSLGYPWRRCGMAASIAVFCCVALTSGDASATVEWGRVGEVTTLTRGRLCKNDGKYIIRDSTTQRRHRIDDAGGDADFDGDGSSQSRQRLHDDRLAERCRHQHSLGD